jgi:hypothetical protein
MSETEGTTPAPESATPSTDEIRYERPEWMTDDQWAEIKARTVHQIDLHLVREYGVAVPRRDCGERAWCTVTDPVEHEEFHASAVVDLVLQDEAHEWAHDDSNRHAPGWWCWLVENRDGSRQSVVIEGYDDEGKHCEAQVDWVQMSVVLAATSTRESHNALLELLNVAIDRPVVE